MAVQTEQDPSPTLAAGRKLHWSNWSSVHPSGPNNGTLMKDGFVPFCDGSIGVQLQNVNGALAMER